MICHTFLRSSGVLLSILCKVFFLVNAIYRGTTRLPRRKGDLGKRFKYYAVYGKGKDYGSVEATTEAFKKFAEVLKKYNVELVIWGFPFGTTEDTVYILKGEVEDYQSLFGKVDHSEANPIESGQRTNMILVP